MAELRFFYGTMGCGKSTLALQNDHNFTASGLRGRCYTMLDRRGPVISSRIGLSRPAAVVNPAFDFLAAVRAEAGRDACASGGSPADRRPVLDYLICDEVQFYSPAQIDQLAVLVDDHGIDVSCYGLTTDFTGRLFDGSQRLLEMADECIRLQVAALCWCGRRGTHNARCCDGKVVYEGEQVVMGDTTVGTGTTDGALATYELLCRRHWREGLNRQVAAELGLAVARS